VGKSGEKIEQRVEFVKGDNDKKNKLLNLLYSGIAPPIMVFVNQKKNCDILSRAINKAGVRPTLRFHTRHTRHTHTTRTTPTRHTRLVNFAWADPQPTQQTVPFGDAAQWQEPGAA
jgi:superfamily II DNA/RNA helicase